jgi:hypothetical protein
VSADKLLIFKEESLKLVSNATVRIDLMVFCRGHKEKRGSGRTAAWDEGEQEKMLVLWLRINKSPKAKQVNNIRRIATAHCQRRRSAVILSFTLTVFDKKCNAPTFDFYPFMCGHIRHYTTKRKFADSVPYEVIKVFN